MDKAEAIYELSKPAYSETKMNQDRQYIAKKLGFTIEEFNMYLEQPNRNHSEFGDSSKRDENLIKGIKFFKPIKFLFK